MKRASHVAFTWESQAVQYPDKRAPGIYHELCDLSYAGRVSCLLYYDHDAILRGILNYYVGCDEIEQDGNVNIFVDPATQRRGIGMALLAEADRRWHLHFGQQTVTPGGEALVRCYRREKRRRERARRSGRKAGGTWGWT